MWLRTLLLLLALLPLAANASAETSDDLKRAVDEDWACSSENMKDTLAKAEKRLVSVSSRWESSLGFVFFSPHHVLTTFSSVMWHESLSVHLPDGSASSVRVVAYNESANLALIELDRTTGLEPLKMGDAVDVGDPVFAVGKTSAFDGGVGTIHAGVVNAIKPSSFKTDALEAFFHREGGPVFDCQGALVGITVGAYSRYVAPIGIARDLTKEIGKQEIYEGPSVRPHLELGLPLHVDERAIGAGMSLGLGLLFRPGFEMKFKGGLVAMHEHENELAGLRMFGQTLLGWRTYVDDDQDVSFSAAAGVTLSHDRFCEDACNDQNPPVIQRTRWLPTVEAGFQFWPAFVSYQYQVDIKAPPLSVHQIMLGIDF